MLAELLALGGAELDDAALEGADALDDGTVGDVLLLPTDAALVHAAQASNVALIMKTPALRRDTGTASTNSFRRRVVGPRLRSPG